MAFLAGRGFEGMRLVLRIFVCVGVFGRGRGVGIEVGFVVSVFGVGVGWFLGGCGGERLGIGAFGLWTLGFGVCGRVGGREKGGEALAEGLGESAASGVGPVRRAR